MFATNNALLGNFECIFKRWGFEALSPYRLLKRFGKRQRDLGGGQAAIRLDETLEVSRPDQLAHHILECNAKGGDLIDTQSKSGRRGMAAESQNQTRISF